MFTNFKNLLKSLKLALLPLMLLVFVGCSTNGGGMGPGDDTETPDPQPEIQTPVSLIVQKITVTAFPSDKTNGDDWDWDPIFKEQRRPDIYVNLGEKNKDADYRSVTKKNAKSSNDYNLSSEHSKSNKSLPYTMKYKDAYSFSLYDDDQLLKNDYMGGKTIYTSDLYCNDNATSFTTTISCSHGVKIKIQGVWTY